MAYTSVDVDGVSSKKKTLTSAEWKESVAGPVLEESRWVEFMGILPIPG
jgi:hypothetical protein